MSVDRTLFASNVKEIATLRLSTAGRAGSAGMTIQEFIETTGLVIAVSCVGRIGLAWILYILVEGSGPALQGLVLTFPTEGMHLRMTKHTKGAYRSMMCLSHGFCNSISRSYSMRSCGLHFSFLAFHISFLSPTCNYL